MNEQTPVLGIPEPVLGMKVKKGESVILVILQDTVVNNHIKGQPSTRPFH